MTGRPPWRVLAAVPVLLAAACGPLTASPPPASSAPSQAAAPQLRPVADEGTVTYSVTLHPGQCHARDGGTLPDPACTPGSIDPHVTQATIHATICVPGWTATIRPPTAQTNRAKYDVSYPAYGLPRAVVAELDHYVPLELGGSNDITNLWPEKGRVPNGKDPIENALRRDVCAGRMTLAAARQAILNWHTAAP